MKYKILSNDITKPILPSELPKVRIDYKGLRSYAQQKGVQIIELSESEKNLYVIPEQ